MKKNKNYRITDNVIQQAFIRLLKKKPFDKITVQDILNETRISRNTFYYHYADKYELAQTLYELLTLRLDAFFSKCELPKDRNFTKNFYMQFFSDNQELIEAVMSIRTEELNFPTMISDYFNKRFRTSSSDSLKPMWLLEMELHVYNGIINGLSNYYLDENHKNIPCALEYSNQAVINACLYTVGIRDQSAYRKIYDYIARFLPCEQDIT